MASREAFAAKEIALERRRFATQFAVSDRVVLSRHEGFFDVMAKEHAYRLTVDLFCKSHDYTHELPSFSYPRDWWQAFRARWLPGWWLKRWPVQVATVGGGRMRLRVDALFPELEPLGERYKVFYTYGSPVFE